MSTTNTLPQVTPANALVINDKTPTDIEALMERLLQVAKGSHLPKIKFLNYRLQGLPQWEAYLLANKNKKSVKPYLKAYNNGGLDDKQRKSLCDTAYQFSKRAILVCRSLTGSDDSLRSLTRTVVELNVANMAVQDDPDTNIKLYSIYNRSGTTINAGSINLYDIEHLLVKNER